MFDDLKKYMPPQSVGAFPPSRPPVGVTPPDASGDLREIINQLLRTEERISRECESLMSTLTQDNTTFKTHISEGYRLFLEEVKNEVTAFQRNVDNSITALTGSHDEEIAAYKAAVEKQISDFAAQVDKKIAEFEQANGDTVNSQIRTFTDALHQFESTVNRTVSDHQTATAQTLETLRETYDEFVRSRIAQQDGKITDMETYMKLNLEGTVKQVIGDMVDSGDIGTGGGSGVTAPLIVTITMSDDTTGTADITSEEVRTACLSGRTVLYTFNGVYIPVSVIEPETDMCSLYTIVALPDITFIMHFTHKQKAITSTSAVLATG